MNSVKIHPPKWGNSNGDFTAKASYSKSDKQKQGNAVRYGRTDDGGYRYENSFAEGGGGLGYEDYRRMNNPNENDASKFSGKGMGREVSGNVDNFDR